MAYNEVLADRVRALMADHETAERKMFGGWCILHHMARVGAPNHERALARPHTRPMSSPAGR